MLVRLAYLLSQWSFSAFSRSKHKRHSNVTPGLQAGVVQVRQMLNAGTTIFRIQQHWQVNRKATTVDYLGASVGIPSEARLTHLANCAAAYGSYKGPSGPNPAYTTKFSNQYGWYATNSNGNEVDWRAIPTPMPPSGSPGCQGASWQSNDATTFPAAVSCSATSWSGNTTIIWASAYTTDAWMVDVLAHEWSHQWGATNEKEAGQVGDAAKQAYLQDGGKKCQ